jgi:Flp pilus assembly protein TadD
MRIVLVALSAFVVSSSLFAQSVPVTQLNPDAQRAQQHYRLGWEAFRTESWPEAVREFRLALDIDAKFKLAYYGLGRSYMSLKQFDNAAAAYERCGSLYEAEASQKFQNMQEADMIRQSDLDQLRLAVNTLTSRSGNLPPSNAAQNQIRQLRDQMQRIQIKRDIVNNDISLTSGVPAFVSLALGSAYFRSERFPEAERAYKSAIEGDPKLGEAWNNLAALYLLRGRLDEADRAVASAEKAGFKVAAGLKEDIGRKKAASR